ncbi:Alpha-ketoglutarate-dependent dioxygenase alkB like 7, mitochondrial, partial [Pseudolycoriella hygida]
MMVVLRHLVNNRRLKGVFAASRAASSVATSPTISKTPQYIDFVDNWPANEKESILNDFIVLPDFVSVEEEKLLIEEVDPYMKRLKYEFDHWDDAIHGFRETERKHWYPHNKKVIQKIAEIAFKGQIMPHIHILDLAENGVIKPHVDSSRYCGTTIAGLSLLSDSVMRLVRTDETKYMQTKNGSNADEYRTLPKSLNATSSFYADVLLKQRSLYIMRDTSRYNFTHEILGNEHGYFKGEKVTKTRRISVICRNSP